MYSYRNANIREKKSVKENIKINLTDTFGL